MQDFFKAPVATGFIPLAPQKFFKASFHIYQEATFYLFIIACNAVECPQNKSVPVITCTVAAINSLRKRNTPVPSVTDVFIEMKHAVFIM